MIEYTKEDLKNGLKAIGLKAGDLVLISTELFTLGRLKGARSKDEHSKMVFEAIRDVLTEKGTVVVNAFTTYVARYGKPFDCKNSRPTTGAFCEYVTFHPESIRSLHPIHSVAAIGALAKDICLNVSASNYGIDSPYERMLKMRGQVLRLGIDYTHNTFLHVVETLYGLPYLYNKIIDADVISDGQRSKKQFLASVRYLNFSLDYSLEKVRQILLKSKCVHSSKVGGGQIHRLDASEYCGHLISLLKEDAYALLKAPPDFIKGEIPWDGITAGRDDVVRSADYNFEYTQ